MVKKWVKEIEKVRGSSRDRKSTDKNEEKKKKWDRKENYLKCGWF